MSGHGALVSGGAEEPATSSEAAVDSDYFRELATILLAFSFFSPGVDGAPVVTALKSKAVPGVLGVLVADPKDANAPDPRPKADDPTVVGEARPVPVIGEWMALKGLRPP